MDLTVAGAYAMTTNDALSAYSQASVLEHKTKLGKTTLAMMDEQIAELKEYNKELKYEHERLVAEGERLKAEGEAIADRNEKAAYHKKTREYYMDRRDNYPFNRKKLRQTFLLKTKLNEKIDRVVAGYVLRKAAANTPYEMPELKFERMGITNQLLNKKNKKHPE